MVINPIVGVYIPIIRIPIKGRMTIPNIATFDHGTHLQFCLVVIGFCAGHRLKEKKGLMIWVVRGPSQDAIVANEGLGWDPLRKNRIILVVTGILGRGDDPTYDCNY